MRTPPLLLSLGLLACGGDGATASPPSAPPSTADSSAPAPTPVTSPTEAIDPTRWELLTGAEALPLPACPDWWCLGLTDPALARTDDGTLVMWFSAGGDQSPGGPVVGRATSDDDGLTWAVAPDEPVRLAAPEAWDVHRETPAMRFDPATQRWTTWYLGYAVDFFTDPGLGQATSLDAEGITWGASQAPIYRAPPGAWDAAFLSGASVVHGPDGVWRLYYAGIGTTQGVGLLESTDGITWVPHPANPVLERDLGSWDQAVMEPEVHWVGDRYVMWFTGYEEPLDLATTPMHIGVATSPDGVTWTRHAANPVLSPDPDPGAWNGLRIVSPSVWIDDDGTALLAVHGQSVADADPSDGVVVLGRIGLYRTATP